MRVGTAIRRAPKMARNALRDLRYGGLLGGTIRTRYRDQGAHDVANSDYDHLETMFAQVEITNEDVIVDVGCGKGRAINWFLSRYPRNATYGLELDPDVCAATAKRLRRHLNVTVICGDATQNLPDTGTVFYLANPFDEPITRAFISALMELPAGGTRRKTVVYYVAESLHLFEDDPRFAVTKLDIPVRHGAAIIGVNA